MQRAAIAALVIALCLGFAQAAAPTVGSTLDMGKYKLFKSLAKCASVDKELTKPGAKVTVLAPTDAAITAFLKLMGMTPAAFLKNEMLCGTLVGYHIIPAVASAADLASTNKTLTAGTLAGKGQNLKILFNNSKVTVTDMQGNMATVTEADINAGDSVIHGVDRVLLNGFVFTSPAAALTFYAKRFSTLAAALKKAGLLSTVTAVGFSGTVLAPGNKAFKKVPGALSLPADTVKNVLLNHVLPVARVIPSDFVNGTSYDTLLKGQSLKYTVAVKNATIRGKARKTGAATFTSMSGASATVVGHNVFAGKAVFHAINNVLLPGGAKTNEKGTTGRRLMREGAEIEDTMSAAQQQQLNEVQDNILWASTTATPNVAGVAADASSSSESILFPTSDEDAW